MIRIIDWIIKHFRRIVNKYFQPNSAIGIDMKYFCVCLMDPVFYLRGYV